MILFRSDTAYGNAGHKPAEILAYEVINLGNLWILEDFRKQYDKTLSMNTKNDIDWFLASVEAGHRKIDDEDIEYTPYLDMFEGIVKAIEKAKGMQIKHLLWLTDMESLLDLYYDQPCIDYLNDIDAYETGVELIHFEGDGHLFAYDQKPKPLNKDIVKETLDNTKGLYKVHVWPGFGYTLQTIYFEHNIISLEEIAAYCVKNNVGYWYTIEEYDKNYGDIECSDQFVYVDLSSYGLDNIAFCTENLLADKRAKIYW